MGGVYGEWDEGCEGRWIRDHGWGVWEVGGGFVAPNLFAGIVFVSVDFDGKRKTRSHRSLCVCARREGE